LSATAFYCGFVVVVAEALACTRPFFAVAAEL
jgi:hypothetical protein